MVFELSYAEESQINEFIESQKREFLCESYSDSARWIFEIEESSEGFRLSVVDRITQNQQRID